MPFRMTDAPTSSNVASQISLARSRYAATQERLSTGKRINRPSDDPQGAAAVISLRTSQAEINQMKRNAGEAGDALLSSDSAIESYETMLDRARAIFSQGASDLTTDTARNSLAVDLDNLRNQMIAIANTRHEDLYIFGGTRQNASPYDPNTGAPAAVPSNERTLRIEPNAQPLIVGFRAEDVFGDANGTVFDLLQNVSAALRGTGNAATDRTTILTGIDRLETLTDRASVARARLGPNLNVVDAARQRLDDGSLASEESIQRIESTNFAEDAIKLSEDQNALQALIQTRGNTNRRSLIDYLG